MALLAQRTGGHVWRPKRLGTCNSTVLIAVSFGVVGCPVRRPRIDGAQPESRRRPGDVASLDPGDSWRDPNRLTQAMTAHRMPCEPMCAMPVATALPAP